MPDLLYRPMFVRSLTVLGKACRIASNSNTGRMPPILVGGAVVELDTAGQFVSGDFDFVTTSDKAFMDALQQVGFTPDLRKGVIRRVGGWFHPELLVGVDMVSGSLFDGQTDKSRIRVVDVDGGEILIPPVEDMIADRLGQWEASGRMDHELFEQARVMYALAGSVDGTYLDKRIRDETANSFGAQILAQGL